MSFFTRLSNGWQISMSSLKVLKAKKELILFPLLSGCSMLLVMASFAVAIFAAAGWDGGNIRFYGGPVATYGALFVFYIVNYFIVVFFNMALVHCAGAHFRGQEVTLREGLAFSFKRIGVIFYWAVFAATVGTILKAIQENAGIVGKIITGLIGIVWNIATFFVVPVIAYENLGPLDAFKRSGQIMKEKWGESLGGNFSFGFVQVLGFLLICLPFYFLGAMVHPFVGIGLAAIAAFIIITTISAAQTIFTSAVYHEINGEAVKDFDSNLTEDLFVHKKSWKL